MACLILAKNRKPQGVFSQRKKLWGAIRILEGLDDPENIEDPVESLKVRTSHNRESVLTYNVLCYCLRSRERVALYDSGNGLPLYAIWNAIENVLICEDE